MTSQSILEDQEYDSFGRPSVGDLKLVRLRVTPGPNSLLEAIVRAIRPWDRDSSDPRQYIHDWKNELVNKGVLPSKDSIVHWTSAPAISNLIGYNLLLFTDKDGVLSTGNQFPQSIYLTHHSYPNNYFHYEYLGSFDEFQTLRTLFPNNHY